MRALRSNIFGFSLLQRNPRSLRLLRPQRLLNSDNPRHISACRRGDLGHLLLPFCQCTFTETQQIFPGPLHPQPQGARAREWMSHISAQSKPQPAKQTNGEAYSETDYVSKYVKTATDEEKERYNEISKRNPEAGKKMKIIRPSSSVRTLPLSGWLGGPPMRSRTKKINQPRLIQNGCIIFKLNLL